MSKDNKDFFKKQSDWAKIKNNLLESYLTVYFRKLAATGRHIYYIDCFAGKGKFEDGEEGSPIIALKKRDECLAHSKHKPKIHSIFVEARYANELLQNVTEYNTPTAPVQVCNGTFEEAITDIVNFEYAPHINLFLYIDPYGVKYLNAQHFKQFAQKNFGSFEMLINFNSFGLFRNACRTQKIELRSEDRQEEILPELEPMEELEFDEKSKALVTQVLGCDDWKKDIIEPYKNKCIDGYQAEQKISKLFKDRLHSMGYKYVLDMPIRLKAGNRPKYRMIYVTQHQDGCVAMADNMVNKSNKLCIEIQTKQQTLLFSQDVEQNIVTEEDLLPRIMELLRGYSNIVSLNVFLSDFYDCFGVLCNQGKIAEQLKKLEDGNKLLVKRDPAKTHGGKPSSFFREEHGQRVWIGLKK